MFKDKTTRALLFGINTELVDNPAKHRVITFNFPAVSQDDKSRSISYPSADGLVLYLLKRIESIESKVTKPESKKK